MVLLPLFDESQTRLADFGYIPECRSKNPRGLNEILLPLARMVVGGGGGGGGVTAPQIPLYLHQYYKLLQSALQDAARIWVNIYTLHYSKHLVSRDLYTLLAICWIFNAMQL